MHSFTLKPVSPFRLDLTAWVLRRAQVNEIDRWDGTTYSRVLVIRDATAQPQPVEVSVVQTGPPESPELLVTAQGPGATEDNRQEIAGELDKMLGLSVDLGEFYGLASSGPLAQLADQFLGFKPPRLGSVFETLANGVFCQQISMVVCIHLLNRLCRAYGLRVGEHYAFPRPEDIAGDTVEQVRTVGLSMRKAEYIVGFSQAIASGDFDPSALEDLGDEAAISRLLKLRGVGKWTAEYVLLRGLGRLDVFPADDLAAQIKLQRWMNLPERPSREGVHQILEPWKPYRGLIYFHLLMDSQARQGLH